MSTQKTICHNYEQDGRFQPQASITSLMLGAINPIVLLLAYIIQVIVVIIDLRLVAVGIRLLVVYVADHVVVVSVVHLSIII